MKLREHVRWERERESPGYLFDRRRGGLFGLNRSAQVVLGGLERGLDEEGLVRELIATCGAGELAARDDVTGFLRLLMENDLVEP